MSNLKNRNNGKYSAWHAIICVYIIIFSDDLLATTIHTDNCSIQTLFLQIKDTCQRKQSGMINVLRKHFQNYLPSLVFRSTKDISKSVMAAIWDDDEEVLTRLCFSYCKHELLPLNFRENSETKVDVDFQSWVVLQGNVFGNQKVKLYILLPAKPITDTDILDVRRYLDAAEEKDGRTHSWNMNTIEKLDYLEKYKLRCVSRVLAHHLRLVPFFYVRERSQINLFDYIIQRRRNRNWISKKDLVQFAEGACQAIRAVHEYQIILRNVTSRSFGLNYAGGNYFIVLEDLGMAQFRKKTSNCYSLPGSYICFKYTKIANFYSFQNICNHIYRRQIGEG